MWIVDAANVIGSRPDGWWRDRAGAARRLLRRIDDAIGTGAVDPPVVMVLEGAARTATPAFEDLGARRRCAVVHAAGSGDDEIVRIVRDAHTTGVAGSHDPVVVVTADRELVRRVRALGATTVGPSTLLAALPDPASPPLS